MVLYTGVSQRKGPFTGALLWESGGIKEGFRDGHLFPWGTRWETWETAHL